MTVWNIAKWPVLLLVVSFMFALLYWAAPNVKQPGFRWISPGGILAVVGWLIASGAFAFYVANFGSYNKTYGALGGVVVFLVWLWISNIVILLGAEFNAELERERAIEGGMQPAGQGAVRRAARHAQDGAPGERVSEEDEGPTPATRSRMSGRRSRPTPRSRWCSTARWPERSRRRSAQGATCRSAWSGRTSS